MRRLFHNGLGRQKVMDWLRVEGCIYLMRQEGCLLRPYLVSLRGGI